MEKCYNDEDFYFNLPQFRKCNSNFPQKLCILRGSTVDSLNPGSIANLHKKVRDIMPNWIEGLSLNCSTNLDVNKTISMKWLMGNSTPYGFRLGGMICKNDGIRNVTKTPILIGDTNPSTLATNFHFIYHPLPKIKLETKIQANGYEKQPRDIVSSAEYLGKSTTLSLTLFNPKCNSGCMTLGFLHSFTKKFCAGTELSGEWKNDQMDYNMAIAARYSQKNKSIAATMSKNGLDLSYYHRASDLFQFGASVIVNSRIAKKNASLFYQMQTKDSVVRGMIDSDWTVGCTYNRHLENLSSAFGFSILYQIPKNKFHLGITFDLNSNLNF